MLRIVICAVFVLMARFSLAAQLNFGFTCTYSRPLSEKIWTAQASFTDQRIEISRNTTYVMNFSAIGFSFGDYFAGNCMGVAADRDKTFLFINWATGKQLDLGARFACSFSGNEVKIRSALRELKGGDEHVSVRYNATASSGEGVEMFVVSGVTQVQGDLRTCDEIFAKEVGGPTTPLSLVENKKLFLKSQSQF